jgi:poly(3-hydroxyalkanoate) depolymerase
MNSAQPAPSTTAEPEPAEEFRMVAVGRRRLQVGVRTGDGRRRPLLLLSGIGANMEMFDPFIEALDPGQGVIRFDVPGVGGSPPPLLPKSIRALAGLTAGLLDALGQGQVDVLGISWGGALAQQFAHQYPARCRRLILVATSAGVIMVPARPSVLARMISPARYLRADYMQRVAPMIYGGRMRSEPDLIPRLLHNVRAPTGRGYAWQLLGSTGWTSLPWLPFLRQPTLIIASDDDPLVPVINAQVLARLIPRATLRIIPGGGHLYLLTDAAEAAAMIQGFLGGE